MRYAILALILTLAPLAAAQDEPFRTPPSRPIDVLRIDIDLTVDLEKRSVQGSATLTLKALRDVKSVRLDAVDHLIRSVQRSEGSSWRATTYAYDGEALVADLPLERGAEARLRVGYRIEDPKSGLHFFGPSEAEPGVPRQMWSQGESIESRYWFPCVDHPDERQATSTTIRVKPGLTVISNGRLTSKLRDPETGLMVWSFVQERPHVAYLVTLVVGTFDVTHETWRGKPLSYYVPVGRKGDAARSFSRTREMLDLFSLLTGQAYPWAKYDQVVVEQFSFGGMENTSATTLNEYTLHDARAHLDFRSEGLVAHELAHQWYGDLLTCRDWSHVWLNESFATYFADVWTAHAEGQDAYDYAILGQSESGMSAGKKRAIVDRRYADPGAMFDGRVYPKGACVLHMLRQQLGDEVFWRGIRAYTEEYKDRSVESVDLRRAMERASGSNLERFFHDWTERPGHPTLDVRLSRDAKRGLLVVRVRQTQKGEPYAFPAELEFMFGEERVVRTLDVTSKDERFVLAEARAPTRFRFDPREAIILKEVKVTKGRDLWLHQLKTDATIGRIRAARALAGQRRPEALKAVRAALAKDPFWGVRVECAKLLGKAAGDEARDALLAGLEADADAKVRRACAEALGARSADPKAAAALRAHVARGDPSYFVEAAVIEAYARAADSRTGAEVLSFLRAQLAKDSHNEVIRQAAIRGLRSLEDPAIVPVLAAYTRLGNPGSVRRAAAESLSAATLPGASPEQIDAAVGALRAYLSQARGRDKRAALRALISLGPLARPALRVIEAARLDVSAKVRDLADRAIEAIRAGAPPQKELKRLRKRASRLEAQVGKLESRAQKAEARLARLEKALKALRGNWR